MNGTGLHSPLERTISMLVSKGSFCALLLSLGAVYGQSLTVSPQQLSFNVPAGVSASGSQMVMVTPDAMATGTQVSFTVAQASSWLRVQGTSGGTINSAPAAGFSLQVNVS